MKKLSHVLGSVFFPVLLAISSVAMAGDVHRANGTYFVHLPASANFQQVVNRLETEIQAQNWDVLKIQDIDTGLKQNYGMDIQSKVVYACKSQYLVQAIKEDPNITLIVPCRFAVYRVGPHGKAAGANTKGGEIVVGVADPAHEAKSLDIHHRKAAEIAGKEPRGILQALAEDYKTH